MKNPRNPTKPLSKLWHQMVALRDGVVDHFYVKNPHLSSNAHVYAKGTNFRMKIITQKVSANKILVMIDETAEAEAILDDVAMPPGAGTSKQAIQQHVEELCIPLNAIMASSLLPHSIKIRAKQLQKEIRQQFRRL